MDLVILLANQTLRGDVAERPLFATKIGGLNLLQRTLRSAQRAGIPRALILAPEGLDLATVAKDRHLQMRVDIRTHRHGVANLSAALVTHGEALPEQFWLTTVDRMLSPAAFPRADVVAAPIVRFLDARNDAIGTYLMTREVVGLAERLGGSTVAGLVEAADDAGMVADHELDRVLWCPIAAVDDLPKAWAALRQSLRKPLGRNADGLAAYYLNRPMSLVMSRWLVQTPITPNQITAIGLVMGLAAAVLAGMGTYPMLLLGGLMLQLSSVVDGVDGEIARMRLTSSHSGEWFDTVCDDVINLSFMAGLGVAAQRITGEPMWLWAALVGVGCGATLAGLLYRELIRAGLASHNNLSWEFETSTDSGKPWLRQFLVGFSYIAKRDSYTVLLVVLLALGLTRVALTIMVVGTVAIFVAYWVQKLRAWMGRGGAR